MENDLPIDAVERLRVIRTRHYEETKNMTREEKREYDRKRYEKAKEWLAEAKPGSYDFSWLSKK